MIIDIQYHTLYNGIVNSDTSLNILFEESDIDNYSGFLDYLTNRMESDFSFFPIGMQPENEIGKKVISSKAQHRLGACIFMISIFGDYNPKGLELGFDYIKTNELYQLDRLCYSSDLFR